jgi:NYN domain
MAAGVVVFVDYQNVYRRARDAFHVHELDPHWFGQIKPLMLGELLASEAPTGVRRELAQVRVYRGLPENKHDPRGYAAARRQVRRWQSNPMVKVITRPLRYPEGWPDPVLPGETPREKGIDVALAVDLAVMAARRECDVAIVCSVDTDILPALEYVAEERRAWGKPVLEVAAWSSPKTTRRRLSVTGGSVWCHWLTEDLYETLRDNADYNDPAS